MGNLELNRNEIDELDFMDEQNEDDYHKFMDLKLKQEKLFKRNIPDNEMAEVVEDNRIAEAMEDKIAEAVKPVAA